ncbi:type II toxin-antitoxin system VapC family toxin [Sandaracinobacteroides saxicola]|uniref:Ribonuclease VapC n=1 Tax=Sandaracinobacteroides saxicola TaxID=2759707 RepID=A0A7G5IF86_9SPHN|nr:type II toxin-antitoxin system VapC family toxin [Sandaracinobacteroides saxicola]QMW22028.1 type II toxin-antitoxin system VapC family toxin [Sandaracinobacteroides saxicola]
MTAITRLLDTSTCLDIIRDRPVSLFEPFARLLPSLAVSAVTVEELRFGANRSARPPHHHAVADRFLGRLHILSFDADDAAEAARVRAELTARGQRIGALDMLIGGHCRRHGLILVTSDRDFRRIANLVIEDWRSPTPDP